MNYLVISDDKYILEEETVRLRDKYLSDKEIDVDFSSYSLPETEEIINSITTLPFMAAKRLVVVKDLEAFAAEVLERFLKYLDHPAESSVVIFQASGNFRKNEYFSRFSALTQIIEKDKLSSHEIKQWVRAFLVKQKITITEEAVNLLLEYKGEEASLIKTELEKLACFSKGGEITLEDIEKAISREAKENIFGIVDAINAKDPKRVFKILDDLYDEKKQPHEVIGYLSWYLRIMQKIILLSERGASVEAMSKELRYSPGYTRRLYEQARKYFTAKKVYNWVNMLLDTDKKIKSGNMQAPLALETVLVKFLKD